MIEFCTVNGRGIPSLLYNVIIDLVMLYSFLFPQTLNKYAKLSCLLLAVRIIFGLLLMTHGIQKLGNFGTLAAGAFPDPLGVGSQLSVSLAIFGELFCSIAFIFGFLYRLSMIPMIVTMLVAFVFAHKGSVTEGELAFVYLIVFLFLYAAGPGKYALDTPIANNLSRKGENKG